jgi:hypothetical protein
LILFDSLIVSRPIDPIRPRLDPEPVHRPVQRFWPYVALPEQPTAEELAALDPDLRTALFGGPPRPFSLTVVFPVFDGPDFARAVELAKQSREYREAGAGAERRIRARYEPGDVEALRDLYAIVGANDGTEVLVDERPVPYARELWLPLFWFLLPR